MGLEFGAWNWLFTSAWVKIKPSGIGPLVLVFVSIYQGSILGPIFDPHTNQTRIWVRLGLCPCKFSWSQHARGGSQAGMCLCAVNSYTWCDGYSSKS